MIHLANCLDPNTVARVVTEPIDLLCVDAPYSAKTHVGHQAGNLTADRAAAFSARPGAGRTREQRYSGRKAARGESGRRDLDYAAWTATEVEAFCGLWIPITRGWVVSITDDLLAPHWLSSFEVNGLLTFAPLPLVETGSRVRMTGDGPSNWTCWLIVGRPRTEAFARWGTLPGAYVVPGERAMNSKHGTTRIVGGKPLSAMEAIVRDYSREGDLVCDPCAGAGTTLIAAKRLGRRVLGMEQDPERHALASRQVAETAHVPGLWPERTKEKDEQEEMFE
jgi:hypothetical protein